MRGEKVILDRELARLYQVEVKVLNQAVKRNSSRFPADFMFQLTAVEAGYLRSQSVTLDGVEAAAGRQNLEAGSPAGAARDHCTLPRTSTHHTRRRAVHRERRLIP